MKPTFLHLALRHETILGEVFHAARVSPHAVEAVVAGVFVEQEIFDRVLAAFNTLARTTYRQEDIRDVCILSAEQTKKAYERASATEQTFGQTY